MGTTESIFWEDEDGTASQQSLPHPSSINRPSPNRPSTGPPRKGGRPPPPPIIRIKGLLLGGPKTGKRTLLARLRGIDPYAPNGESQTSDPSSAAVPLPQPVRGANIQYQPTDRKQCWDRILLQVQTTRTIDPEQHGATDFAILMIHPQHRFDKTRSYVLSVVATLLRQAGYKPRQQPQATIESKNDESENRAEADDPQNEQSKDDATEMHPICLCVLFNFRDFELPQEKRTEIQESIKNLIHTLIQDHFEVPAEMVALQFAETCLRNCYGLNVLHHFIYRTYLLRKMIDLQRQLKQVQQQANKTEGYPVMAYDEFIHALEDDERQQQERDRAERQAQQQQAPIELQSDLVAEAAQLRQQMLLQQQQLQQKEPKQHARSSVETKSKSRAPPAPEPSQPADVTPIRRNVMFQKLPPKFPSGMGKDALEAFLADSSDEEEEQRAPQQKVKKPKSVVFDSSDDDDDDEDDFFYDEQGNRRVNHPSHARDTSSTTKSAAPPPALRKEAPSPPPLPTPLKPIEPKSTPPMEAEKKAAAELPKEMVSPKDPNTNTAHNGSSEEDSQKEDYSPKAASSTQEANQKQELRSQSSTTSADAPDYPEPIVATKATDDGWSDEEDDDDDFVIESTPVLESDEEEDEEEATKDPPKAPAPAPQVDTTESPKATQASPKEDDNDNDKDEPADFVVAHGTSAIITSVSDDDDSWGDDDDDNGNYQPISTPAAPAAPSPPTGGGLSAAALAAIAAAQKEAEAMLHQQAAPSEIIPERKKKKKKDKSEKKEKKKKKDKKKSKESN